jgi:hypothetical protein
MKTTLKWNELSERGFVKTMTKNSGASHKYTVTKPNTELYWPENTELISWCDGGPGMNWGGNVEFSGDAAYVTVYVD